MSIITLPRLLAALVSLAILAAGAYFLWSWFHGQPVQTLEGDWIRTRGEIWRLYLGGGLTLWSVLGRFVVLLVIARGGGRRDARRLEGRHIRSQASALWVADAGESSEPTLVLTHGWGLNATVWAYLGEELRQRYRVVTWDLPGLGRSERLKGDYSIDAFAIALAQVVETTTSGPVILVGHSIGGMTTQTFWRNAPASLRERVAGMVLVDTTHLNPLRTMLLSRLLLALQRPLLEPVGKLTILLAPIAWLSAWQSYLSGANHLVMRIGGFGRHATRSQVDLVARLSAKGSPAVQAQGDLAMLHWSVTDDLPAIRVPTLVIAGDLDIVTLPRASEEIARGIPGATLQAASGAGHMGFMEASEAYAAPIIAFAEAQFGAAPREDVASGEPRLSVGLS